MGKVTRRKALTTLAAAGTGALMTGLYTWRVEPHWLEFTYPVLPVRGLPSELEGRTLAQITDLHVGPKVDDDYVIKSFRRVQELTLILSSSPVTGSLTVGRASLSNCVA